MITKCNQAPTIKFSSRNSSTIWDFTVKSLKLLKGVTLLGVEHLQHFAIADVALVSKEGDFKYESKGQECLLKDDDEEENEEGEEDEKEDEEENEKEEGRRESAAESTTPPPPTIYKYSFKLKFHTKIFGTFKQTLVLDFGVRPLLSKVHRQYKSEKKKSTLSFSDGHRRCGFLLCRVGPSVRQGVYHLDQRPLGLDQLRDCQI